MCVNCVSRSTNQNCYGKHFRPIDNIACASIPVRDKASDDIACASGPFSDKASDTIACSVSPEAQSKVLLPMSLKDPDFKTLLAFKTLPALSLKGPEAQAKVSLASSLRDQEAQAKVSLASSLKDKRHRLRFHWPCL